MYSQTFNEGLNIFKYIMTCMYGRETVFIGLIRDHRTRIGRIRAVKGDLIGCKSEDRVG